MYLQESGEKPEIGQSELEIDMYANFKEDN